MTHDEQLENADPTSTRKNAMAPDTPVADATRRSFLSKGLAASGAVFAYAVTRPAPASAQGRGQQTRLNFRDIRRHENDHVAFLLDFLGDICRAQDQTFKISCSPNVREFFQVSQALENTRVSRACHVGFSAREDAHPRLQSFD